jgi:hypothetical protein
MGELEVVLDHLVARKLVLLRRRLRPANVAEAAPGLVSR